MPESNFIGDLARSMARSSVEEKEAFLVRYLTDHPELLLRIEDLVLEEAPIKFDTVLNDTFDIESNDYKFVVSYKWRIRPITDEERVLRYVDREYAKIKSYLAKEPDAEFERTQRERLSERGWCLIKDEVRI